MSFKQWVSDEIGLWGFVFRVAIIAIIVGFIGWFSYSTFAPMYEQARFNTFKNSQAYNDGMVRELSSFRLQWATTSDANKKAAIKAGVVQQYGAYDRSRLPIDLQSFIAEVEAF